MLIPLNIRKKLSEFYQSGPAGRAAATAFCELYILKQKLTSAKPFMDNNPLVLAAHRYKFLFIGLPKAATQTFLNSFYFDKNNRRFYDVELIEKRPAAQTAFARYGGYYSFSLVRNPWARALSCYNSKIANPDPVKRARILSLYKGLKPGMSFLEFTRWLCREEGRDEIADRHWLSQNQFLRDSSGAIACTQIGRFENMHEELEILYKKSGLRPLALKTRAFKSGASAYQKNYCTEARDNIARRYAEDITLFDYRFED